MLPITVVIPTYNGAAYIEEALASVFVQTLPPAEVIVVDDCSKDGTAHLVQRIAELAPIPLRLIRQTRNSGGPARPINIGIAAARTDLIAVLDQDDTFMPDKIERQARVLLDDPYIALVGGFCSLRDTPDLSQTRQLEVFRQLGGSSVTEHQVFSGPDVLRAFISLGTFLVGYPGFMFRKAHWQAKGGVDERLRIASDLDLLCWLCTQGSVALFPVVHYVRREHDANVCNDKQRMYLDLARVRARYLAGQRWLLEEDAVSDPMREWFAIFSYFLREAGNYRGAWECCRLMAQVWGWDAPLVRAVCKLGLHLVWRQLTRKPPVYNSWTKDGSPRPARIEREQTW